MNTSLPSDDAKRRSDSSVSDGIRIGARTVATEPYSGDRRDQSATVRAQFIAPSLADGSFTHRDQSATVRAQ